MYRFSHLLPHPRYDIFCSRFLEDIFKRFDINIFLYVNYVWKKRFHRVIPSKWDVFENNREVMRWATGIIERSDFSTLAHHFIKLNAGPKIIDFVRYRYRARGSWSLSVGSPASRSTSQTDGTRGAKRSQRNEITINMVAPLSSSVATFSLGRSHKRVLIRFFYEVFLWGDYSQNYSRT